MKYTLSIIIIFIFTHFSFSQSESLKIQLTRSSKILNLIKLDNQGFILKTGKDIPNSKKLDWTLSYYNKDLSLNWSVKIKKNQINKRLRNHIILSPNFETIFHIEERAYNNTQYNPLNKTSYFITQINNKGDTSIIDLKGFKEWEGEIQNIFCNNNFLYFLIEEEVSQAVDDSQNFALIRLDNKTHITTRIPLELPITNKESSLWTFSDNTENQIVLSRKFRDKCEIINLDNDGNKVSTLTLPYDLTVKTVPSVNVESNIFSYYHYNLESYFKEGKSNYGSVRKRGGYGDIILDLENENYYAYGLLGDKDKTNYKTSGIYLNKYDLKGQLIWSKTNKFPSNLLKNNLFIDGYTKSPNDYRILSLKNNSPNDGSLSFRINCKNELNIIDFSKETGDKLSSNYLKSSLFDYQNFYQINIGSKKSRTYVENLDKKIRDLNFLLFSEGENAIFFDTKKYQVNLLYFKH
jgi:hypothetical protein